MKAIILDNKTYKVQQERVFFVYYIDSKGKTKCALVSEVQFCETESVEKTSISVKTKKLNKANFMSVEEYRNSQAGRMSDEEWDDYRVAKIAGDLQSSLR